MKHIFILFLILWSGTLLAQTSDSTSNDFNPNVKLNQSQVGLVCSAIRSKSQGIHTEDGYNFRRYEELILEYLGTDVSDPKAQEKIKQFIQASYKDCYCDKYQDNPTGGLLQLFVHNDWEDGILEFIKYNEIDIYTITDKNGTLILHWIDQEIQGNNITDEHKQIYKRIKEAIIYQANHTDDDDFWGY